MKQKGKKTGTPENAWIFCEFINQSNKNQSKNIGKNDDYDEMVVLVMIYNQSICKMKIITGIYNEKK